VAIAFFDDTAFEASATPTMGVVMGVAFHSACHALGITDRTGPQTRTLARRIAALAQHGETDPIRLCHGALASLERKAPARRSSVVAWRARARDLPARRIPA
jgi:hypothetical protein